MADKAQKWSSTSSIWTSLKLSGGREFHTETMQVIELMRAGQGGLSTELGRRYQKGYYPCFLWTGLNEGCPEDVGKPTTLSGLVENLKLSIDDVARQWRIGQCRALFLT